MVFFFFFFFFFPLVALKSTTKQDVTLLFPVAAGHLGKQDSYPGRCLSFIRVSFTFKETTRRIQPLLQFGGGSASSQLTFQSAKPSTQKRMELTVWCFLPPTPNLVALVGVPSLCQVFWWFKRASAAFLHVGRAGEREAWKSLPAIG